MDFHIGPFIYRLIISDRAIFDAEGLELEGLAIEGRRLLILSRIVEVDRREEVALHEIAHAWRFHFPAASDEEERCQFTATIAQQFYADLERQGGREALKQLPTQRVPHLGRPAPARQAPFARESFGRPDRVECSICAAETMCGSVTNGIPALHEPTNQMRIERGFRCDACGCVTVWQETCAVDGTPLGEYVAVPPPRVLRGVKAARWLAEQADSAGSPAASCDHTGGPNTGVAGRSGREPS